MTKSELQWMTDIQINARLGDVWAVIDDLTLVPRYHPEVKLVEYLSGHTRRAPGVTYRCTIPDGPRKGWCVERVIEHELADRNVRMDGDCRVSLFGHELSKKDPDFWYMMQIAMVAGFFFSYPVIWWLVNRGIKEKM